jgi:hypothetical protein
MFLESGYNSVNIEVNININLLSYFKFFLKIQCF